MLGRGSETPAKQTNKNRQTFASPAFLLFGFLFKGGEQA
jgi:hypothetical protein